MARDGRMLRRFFASTRGMAAIEFGFLFPVLMVLLLAGIDGGRAIALSMKVRSAAYALDAIANQYSSIYDADLANILCATSSVLAPYSTSPLAITLTQIKIGSNGHTHVSWSDTQNGTAYTVGATITIPSQLTATSVPNNACASYPCYVLLAEVNYTYTPMFGHYITGPINLSDKVYVTPRNVVCIQRNGTLPASC